MRKKWNIPLLLLTLVILLAGLSHIIYSRMERNWSNTHEFHFKLPFPEEIVKRYSLTNKIRIDKVIIAGPFSSWNAFDDDFKMYWEDKNSWGISLFLPPGRNQYKFVVHTQDAVYDSKDMEWRHEIWVHDQWAKRQEPDSHGGKNSLIVIQDITEYRRVTNTAFLGLAILLVLYLVLKPLIQHLINMHSPYRIKLVLITGIILLASNILYIVYNILEMRYLTREAYIDETYFFLNPLTKSMNRSVDMRDLDFSLIKREMESFLSNTMDRDEKNQYINNQHKISSIMIFDINLQPRIHAIRPQAHKLESLHMSQSTYTNLQDFFIGQYYTNILMNIRKGRFSPMMPGFVLKNHFTDRERPKILDKTRILLGYDTMIIPLRNKRTLYGYAFFNLHTDLLGLEIRRIIVFNVIMMIFILGLMYFLLYDLGGILSMEEEARNDGLTGIFNRRNLDAVLNREILRTRREKQSLGLIMMDLDHFKELNDKQGHIAGDHILQESTRIIESCIRRPADELGRYGGEEFCIILPNTDIEGTVRVAECIRRKLEQHHFKVDDKKIEVRASLGCYAAIPDLDSSSTQYYKRADQALYQAKKTGRNKVEVWEKGKE